MFTAATKKVVIVDSIWSCRRSSTHKKCLITPTLQSHRATRVRCISFCALYECLCCDNDWQTKCRTMAKKVKSRTATVDRVNREKNAKLIRAHSGVCKKKKKLKRKNRKMLTYRSYQMKVVMIKCRKKLYKKTAVRWGKQEQHESV